MIQEMTGEELLNKYKIESMTIRVERWHKPVTLTLMSSNKQFEGRLWWDSDDGYEMFWDGDAPPEADRPEFEYILDSLTRQDYY
jgi:hypothetical protein